MQKVDQFSAGNEDGIFTDSFSWEILKIDVIVTVSSQVWTHSHVAILEDDKIDDILFFLLHVWPSWIGA